MSPLLRFESFGDLDRIFDQALNRRRQPSFPMDAYRHGDTVVVHFDLPGVDPESIEVEHERKLLTVSAERSWRPVDGDQVLAAERVHGHFRRELLIGDGLDSDRIHATYEHGVLTVTIPVSEKAKPKRVSVAVGGGPVAIDQSSPGIVETTST